MSDLLAVYIVLMTFQGYLAKHSSPLSLRSSDTKYDRLEPGIKRF